MTNEVSTNKKVKKVAESIDELDRDESIKIGLSSIINDEDVDKQNNVKKVNDGFQSFCESIVFVDSTV